MKASPVSASRTGGFTMIEILAVLLIVSVLAAILVTQLGGAEEAARIQNTRRRLAMVEALVDAWANEHGDAPPSEFRADQGVSNEGTNVGIEALVVALWSGEWEAGGLADLEEALVNVDGDRSSQPLANFPSSALLEIPDDWGNPLAYLHRRSYESRDRDYVTLDPVTGEELTSTPRAFRNAATGRFHRASSFQLHSAGPDARFGTEDDLTNFERSADGGS